MTTRIASATFSTCKEYRWRLTRQINNSKKELIFIGLNPSLANAGQNDQTLRRLLRFAECWGYGTLVVINLFAKISKSPKLLSLCNDPVGWKNDFELDHWINYWEKNDSCELWIGWGVHGKLMNRNTRILKRINKTSKNPYVIGLTKDGHPKHPLYLSKKKTLFYFKLSIP